MLSEVRSAIATRLKTISGLRVTEDGHVLSDISPPAAMVAPGDLRTPTRPIAEFDNAMTGGTKYLFTVKVAVSAASDRAAQTATDAYLADKGDQSLKVAIESGGPLRVDGVQVAHYAQVTEIAYYGFSTWGQNIYFGGDVLVEALT